LQFLLLDVSAAVALTVPVLGHRGLRWVGWHLIGIEFFIDLLLLVDDRDNERSGAAGRKR
jgi:hypothetical protein